MYLQSIGDRQAVFVFLVSLRGIRIAVSIDLKNPVIVFFTVRGVLCQRQPGYLGRSVRQFLRPPHLFDGSTVRPEELKPDRWMFVFLINPELMRCYIDGFFHIGVGDGQTVLLLLVAWRGKIMALRIDLMDPVSERDSTLAVLGQRRPDHLGRSVFQFLRLPHFGKGVALRPEELEPDRRTSAGSANPYFAGGHIDSLYDVGIGDGQTVLLLLVASGCIRIAIHVHFTDTVGVVLAALIRLGHMFPNGKIDAIRKVARFCIFDWLRITASGAAVKFEVNIWTRQRTSRPYFAGHNRRSSLRCTRLLIGIDDKQACLELDVILRDVVLSVFINFLDIVMVGPPLQIGLWQMLPDGKFRAVR